MKPIITVNGISKSYGSTAALQNLSFSVEPGHIFGILGENGAGKSTAVECILGTRKPDCGTVTIMDMDPVSDRRMLFQHIGVQFQECSFPDKIRVDELCKETAVLYQNSADFKELLHQFGLDEKMYNYVSELSGGQRQRLFIVLALIPKPQIVFLDELTTGLDPRARRDVWHCLKSMKQNGMTIVLTSHFMDEVEALCDHILILKKGTAVFEGAPGEAVNISPRSTLEEAYLWLTEQEEYN
ncbi:ABC transporter ATP-binding protein [Clostridium sp. AM58-1XD]|uniref:ABC transporter ATP-binding protein n=1 Tax=Clostridium sp. AM58-1XD TaxID=2292307 RepID=UPI000E4CD4C8|nr:ABC transporter ATP-binding protein [Clostridium sp. AM58-1XD]RGY97369.1 ABC transporter ATP-binding protein [Clostridium sp. AM58-1XD]